MRTICSFGLPIYVSMDWWLFWGIGVWILFMERQIGHKSNFFHFSWNHDSISMKCSPWWFLRLMTMILLNCVKAVFCVHCIFGSNSLNGVQLVPQGFPRWIGLQLDYIEWWVFPVFKPTYGLSKAVGLPFLSTTSSFLVHTLLKNLSRFYQVSCQDFEEVLAWAIGGWSQCKFQEACMAQCSLFPMIPHCMSLLATPTDLWLEGIFVPFNFTLDYPALKNACETWKGPFEILLMHSEASQSSLFHSVCWRWVLWLDSIHLH